MHFKGEYKTIIWDRILFPVYKNYTAFAAVRELKFTLSERSNMNKFSVQSDTWNAYLYVAMCFSTCTTKAVIMWSRRQDCNWRERYIEFR